MVKLGDPAECCSCHEIVETYFYHQRLGVAVCFHCPLTNVMGEDVSTHTMYWVGATALDRANAV